MMESFEFYDNTIDQTNHLNRKILNFEDVKHWQQKSPGYQDLTSFIRQLNSFATGQHNGFANLDLITNPKLVELKSLLDTLTLKVDSILPFSDDKNQRFGNKAFRVWFDEMKSQLDNYFSKFDPDNAKELRPYLEDSFGNRQRIDYGTGHELNFIIFLLGLYKLGKISFDLITFLFVLNDVLKLLQSE